MSYFDAVNDSVQRNKVVEKYKYFDFFYYNVKRMITSDIFKKNGRIGVVHSGCEFNFRRKIKKGNLTIYVNSGYICTTISLQNEDYYRSVQCQHIVESDRKRSKKNSSSGDYERRRSGTSSSRSSDDSSSMSSPSNPSNPFM